MAEGWHADAEGILLFVSPTSSSFIPRASDENSDFVDRFVLRGRRVIAFTVHPGLPAEHTRYLTITSCECQPISH